MCSRPSGRPSAGASGGSTGRARPTSPEIVTSTRRPRSTTQLTGPRRTTTAVAGHQRTGQLLATHRTEQGRQPVADQCRLLVPLIGSQVRHPPGQVTDDRFRVALEDPAGCHDGGVVRAPVGDPGARTLADAELGGAARRRVRRRDEWSPRAGSSSAAGARPTGAPRRPGWPSTVTGAGRDARRSATGS